MEVGAAMQAARFARAALGDRLVVLREARLRQIDPEAAPGLRREGGAVPGDPGWDRAVEQVDPHADPGERRRRDALDRVAAQILVDAALDYPEHRLVRGALPLVPLEAAIEPAVGSLCGARRVVAIGVRRRALVEGERDVGAERGLDPHRLLRAEKAVRAVEERPEGDTLLGDLHLRPARDAA